MPQTKTPHKLEPINKIVVNAMLWLNGLAHIAIGMALATSVIMFTWMFFIDVRNVIYNVDLMQGFLYALGTLMLLWTITALIAAEIRYLMGGRLLLETFIEVALVLFLRKIILLPEQTIVPTLTEIGIWLGGAFILCIIYVVMRMANNNTDRKGQVRQTDVDVLK